MEDEREDLPSNVEYYSPAALEVVDLAREISATLQQPERQALPDTAAELNECKLIEEQVHKHARYRRDADQEEENLKGHAFMARLRANCTTCGTERDVHLIGDAYHKEADVTNDLVRCTTCQAEFVNLVPISHADKLKWMEYQLTLLTTVREDGLTWAEKAPDQAAMHAMVAGIEAMRRIEAERATKQRTHELALQKVEDQLEVMRDILVRMQLRLSGFTAPGGMA
jgi:hypothetical protein